jgi:sigma-B regulation protein RsbU (phosphoserine phosphatase)
MLVIIIKKSEEILVKKALVAHNEIREKNIIMTKELELANRIHKSLIPLSMKNDLADIAVSYKPMLYMGGDYAKFHFIDKDKLMLIVADVTGHGVSSALLVNRIHTEIERLLRESFDPGLILKGLDEFINKDFGKMGYYLSAFCGLLDFSRNKLIYSNHGHPPQILLQSGDNKIVLMESQTILMGIGMDAAGIYSSEIPFAKGDRLILFTDGVIEAKDKAGELFGYELLDEFVKQNSGKEVVDFNNSLIKKLDEFQSGAQNDDIFLLTIQTKR